MATARRTRKAAPKAVEPEELEEIDELEDETDDIEDDTDDVEPEPVKKTTRRKKAPEPEPDDDLEDVDELEDDEEENAPKKRQPPKRAPIQFGSAWLAGVVNEKLGTDHNAYTIRGLVRRMVKAGKFERAVGEDRSRYEFTGKTDPRVKEIVAFVKEAGTEIKSSRTDNLAKARAKAAENRAKRAAEAEEDEDDEIDEAPKPRTRKASAKKAPAKKKPVEDDEEDDDFEDLDD